MFNRLVVVMYCPGAGGAFLTHVLHGRIYNLTAISVEHAGLEGLCKFRKTDNTLNSLNDLITIHGWELEDFIGYADARNIQFDLVALNFNNPEMSMFGRRVLELKHDTSVFPKYSVEGFELANEMYSKYENLICCTLDYKKIFFDRDTKELQNLIDWTYSKISMKTLKRILTTYTDLHIKLVNDN